MRPGGGVEVLNSAPAVASGQGFNRETPEMKSYIMPSIVRHFIYPFYRGFRKDRVLSILNELERTQWLSGEEVEEVQWRRLISLLRQAALHVPYYRELFKKRDIDADAVESPSDFRKIPFLTRNLIRDNRRELVSADPLRKGYVASTGDYAGELLEVFCDYSAGPVRRANTLRQLRAAGVDIGEKQLYLVGFQSDRPLKERFKEGIKDFFYNRRFLSAFDMSEDNMKRYAAIECSYKPSLIVGIPSALTLLSKFCLDNSIELQPPKAIFTKGETLYQDQRETIEKAFSAPVFNRYGSREFAEVACECEKHDGMHLSSDLFYVEVIGPGGRVAAPGEEGELVITDLSNLYMPFIRYRTGDKAVQSDRQCPCGRGLPLLERIEARTVDSVRTPGGKVVPGFFWMWLSRTVPGIKRFQVEQRRLSSIDYRLVPGPEWRDEYAEELKEKIRANCGDNMRVNMMIVDEIPASKNGRARFIISNIKERLVIKSKIHKANITGVETGLNDCLRIDAELMDLADISEFEKILIVNSTNGSRLETFAVRGERGTGEIISCGGVSNQASRGDEIGIMAFTWSSEQESSFSNILVDEKNRFSRYLTEKAGDRI